MGLRAQREGGIRSLGVTGFRAHVYRDFRFVVFLILEALHCFGTKAWSLKLRKQNPRESF